MSKICPLIQKECVQHQCEWWIHLYGADPQTGQPKDEWGCTLRWLPILLTENAAQMRKAAASSDKVATEVAKFHATSLGCMNETARENLIAANPRLLPSLPQGEANGHTNGKS